jgi:hypothetical protein
MTNAQTPVKEWWKSRTIVAGLVSVGVSALSMAGLELPIATPLLSDMVFSAITLVTGGVAIWGRVNASATIAPVAKNNL